MSQATSPSTVEELVDRIRNLHVNWRSGRPALYQPIALLWAIGRARRGEPRLTSWQDTERALRDLLQRHGTRGERGRPDYPIAALCGIHLWEAPGQIDAVPRAHGDAKLRQWFEEHQPTSGLPEPVYLLMNGSGYARTAVVNTILRSYFQDLDPRELLHDVGLPDSEITNDLDDSHDLVLASLTAQEQYSRLCHLVEESELEAGGRTRRMMSELVRLPAARKAVLVRSEGRCENPRCSGQPADVTDRGDPILEVDHVQDLALGGRDHPGYMVALCPNCHAIKTRGRTRDRLRETLWQIANEHHAEWRSKSSALE